MAGKKRTTTRKVVNNRKAVVSRPSKASLSLYDYFRFGESYTSLILGIVVVIIATILLVTFVRGRQAASNPSQETSSISTQESTELNGEVYTVKAGDDLWKIAQEEYNDGFMWSQIAKANNIANPSVIEVGTKLTLPKTQTKVEETTVSVQPVAPQQTTMTTDQQATKITGNSYTVVSGDDLWDIAVRAYGDGYRWVDIAKANNLTNPDVIHSDNKLSIPRN